MFDDRTKIVRSALERVIRRPYRYPKHDCLAVVSKVVRAIDRSVVLPPYPKGTQAEAYNTIIDCGGNICWAEQNMHLSRGLEFGPEEVRPGDIFLHADPDHALGAWIGVFDPSIIPVSWTEENILKPMTGWPERIWTYG